jgi:hypothetical protein
VRSARSLRFVSAVRFVTCLSARTNYINLQTTHAQNAQRRLQSSASSRASRSFCASTLASATNASQRFLWVSICSIALALPHVSHILNYTVNTVSYYLTPGENYDSRLSACTISVGPGVVQSILQFCLSTGGKCRYFCGCLFRRLQLTLGDCGLLLCCMG